MNSLLGHGGTNGISPLLCALEHDHAEQKTRDTGCDMRLFVPRSGEERRCGLPVDGITREQRVCIHQMRVSPAPFRLLLGHCFGAHATPGGARSSASLRAPRWGLGPAQNKFENGGSEHRPNFFRVPPRKQTFGTWESRPLAWLRPGVTRADREFKKRRL